MAERCIACETTTDGGFLRAYRDKDDAIGFLRLCWDCVERLREPEREATWRRALEAQGGRPVLRAGGAGRS